MSALDNTSLGNSFTQSGSNNLEDEIGFNGTLKRSPKFLIKEPLHAKNTKLSSETQPIESRPITTIPAIQK